MLVGVASFLFHRKLCLREQQNTSRMNIVNGSVRCVRGEWWLRCHGGTLENYFDFWILVVFSIALANPLQY